ncbi:hypothetical protein LWI29_000765 [Acer saccharum]|uniref:non-specific serine/threonine protein kinase n=1 Tax=Acer saccharum TaxID=4024 RepID=A0AA39RGL0_ACESA|nr:hypothetical protein LWI29_000765 [Acer saccharum]
MAGASSLLLLVISHLSLLSWAEDVTGFNPKCPSLPCGILGNIRFPFTNRRHPECGLLMVDDCSKTYPQKIQLGKDGPLFYITDIKQDNTVKLRGLETSELLKKQTCGSFKNYTLPSSPFYSFVIPSNLTMLKCLPTNVADPLRVCNDSSHSIFFYHQPTCNSTCPSAQCSVIQPLVNKTQKNVFLHNMYNGAFFLQVNVTKECYDCYSRGGECQSGINGKFNCSRAKTGFGIGGSVLLIVALSIYITQCRRKGIYASPNSRYTSSDPSSKSDLEAASAYFGVPVFSYIELTEATNNFNHEKELGDGGFGTVYYGKLRDGREVAVKRLYEHNYRRVEQFMNEIEILTRLRHKNLVSLYGCTSRHSQGLLLVYEFIPNGTIADHLHGDRANPCLLTWPIRMNIAIETASALAYLHASDIIHRDVKTNNILLDNNFCVKVADFGLSRLFPTDVTHVSTAPQGTPGYVDPEYHQCYQLTDKSDVYSFGVVLIELISSMPAVDISRHKHEINLSNLAINRIQKQAIDELVDPCLGFHSDEEVKRTATSVAELAFLCLQQIKEMRPSMDVVLEELQRIKSGECKPENLTREDDDDKKELKSMQQPPPSPPHSEESALLKNIKLPPSPISVTENWISNDTTPNVSN